MIRTIARVVAALAALAALAWPAPLPAHSSHVTSTSLSCSPNPVTRGSSTTCTMTVTDINSSQNAQPIGTLTLYRGSVAPANLIASCTAGGVPNQTASRCAVTYTPSVAGNETLIASFTNTATGSNPHQWCSSSQTTGGCGGTTTGTAALTINPAPAASLRIVQSPSGQPTNTVAGAAIQRAGGGGIQVEVLNTLGERMTTGAGATLSVTMAIQTNAGGGTLSGTLTVSAVSGVATFSTLSINKSGVGYRLRATASGVTGVNTTTFDITAAAASKFAFAQQPGNTVAGQAIGGGVGVTVRVEDTFGNVVTTDNSTQITVAIQNNPGGGTLSGTATATAVAGVATFSNLSIDKASVGYTLQGTGIYTAATSIDFDIVAGTAARVAFGQQPATTTAGQIISGGNVTVRVEDGFGNLITGSSAQVTVALAANPGSTALQGTLTVGAVSGIATFGNLVIPTTANGYTLSATTPGLIGTTSASFNITPSAAVKLAYGQPPTNNEADSVITPAITVRVEDASGNLVNDSRTVTIAFGANPGGAALQGTTSVAAVAGIATFSDLQIAEAATGYTLTASAGGGLTSVTSSAFTIAAGAPTRLEYQQEPTNNTAGAIFSPAIVVRILDDPGNVVTTATQQVSLAIGNNPAGGTLSGTTTINAVNGVATFNTLSINRAGTGYTLVASATSLASATSNAFDIATDVAALLKFGQQPSNTVAGESISTLVGGVTVRVEDSSGNLVTNSSAQVSLSIEFDAGGTGTALNGTVTTNAVNGIATFPNLSISRVGSGYTLRAANASLTNAISSAFNITHAAAAKLTFGTQPSNTTAGAVITPAVTVRVLDQFDNLVSDSTASVALSFGSNPGGGVIGGNATANAVGGVATFGNLTIAKSGNGYTLVANSGGLAGATSNAFNVNPGSASKLGFTVQPSNTPLLSTITPAIQVAVQDALGNTITASSAPVSVVIDNNPGGADLNGTTTVNAVNGIATFSTLSISKTGTGYTLAANSSGLSGAGSAAFNITIGPPAKLAFVQQPVNAAPATVMTPWPSVQAQDAAGNPVDYTGNITIAKGDPGGTCGGTLSGTLTVAATNGLATFSTLQISAAGTNCTLVATSGSLTSGTSNAFDVIAPTFTFDSLSPSSGPSTGGTVVSIYGSGFAPQIGRYQVIFGTANPAPPVTATRLSSNELQVDSPAHPPGLVNVIVRDTSDNATRAIQNVYTYISSAPAKLGFGDQPSELTAGDPFSPVVTVEVLDVNNNLVNNATHSITISFHTNTAGGALLGSTTVAAVNGVATFSDLSVDKVGTGYRLMATASGLQDPAPSDAFAVVAGAADKLAFRQQPTNNDPAVPITPAVTVEVQDQFDNLVTSSTATVDMEIGINAGAGTLSGGVTVTASAGVATFNSISIDKAGEGYTLIATSDGLDDAESSTFEINFGLPAKVTVTTHPGNGVAGEALTPAIVAQIEDNQGNLVEDYSDPVSITIEENVGGSTLTGTLSVNAVDGVATFNNVVLDKVGLGYKLAANAFGLASGITDPFDISNNVAAGLIFTSQPDDVSQGSVITPSLQVQVVDAFNNHVPDATNSVSMAIGNNPGGGTLNGTTTRNAVGGVASFNDLTINAGGNNYTLVASSAGLNSATSMSFNVIGVGGTFNMFSPTTAAGAIVGYLPTIVAGEDFCVDMVKINDAGTAPANYTNITVTLQMLDASVNTGSLQPGNCRSSWTVIQEWTGIAASPGDGSRINICAGLQGPSGSQTLNNLNESDVWPNVRFRAFTTAGNQGVGCSNDAFSLRPDFFELSSLTVTDEDWQTAGTTRDLILPGAPTTSGGPVHAAGRPFRISVTAINKQGQATSNYDGKPTVEVRERLLPDPCTGCPTPEVPSSGWGQSAVAGAVRTNQAVYHDAGALKIRLVDTTFSSVDQIDIDLGLMDSDAGVIVSQEIDIGRFVPDGFVVLPANTPEFWTQGDDNDGGTCSPRSFTYVGQSFGYKTLPQATVSARSANGAVTPGYRGALWKLTPAKVTQEYTDNTNPSEAADLDTSMAPLTSGNATLVSNDNGTGTLTLNAADRLLYTREALVAAGDPLVLPDPPLPFDAFISLTLRVFDDAETAVTGNAQINTSAPGLFSNIAFDGGNEFRYGRMRLINTVGSELEPLLLPYRLQTWQDVGNDIKAWVTDGDDHCSTFQTGDFSVQNIQDTGAGGLNPVLQSVTSPTLDGTGDLTFGAQQAAVTGSFEVFGGTIPSYFWFNWNPDDANTEVGPTAKAAFGVNEGNPRRIFRSQSFAPRGSN